MPQKYVNENPPPDFPRPPAPPMPPPAITESSAVTPFTFRDRQRIRLLQASGFASLLNEILGCGALHRYGDADLVERVRRASRDNERYHAELLKLNPDDAEAKGQR